MQWENAQFGREIQKLPLILQTLPELNQQYEMQFFRKSIEEGIYFLEMEKKFYIVYENINLLYQNLNFYRKMVKDLEKQLDIPFPSTQGGSIPMRK